MSTTWEKLYATGRPVIGLSPMDGVTDAPFRYMVAKYGHPDVIFTEFVSVDALHYATGEKRERLLQAFILAREVRDKYRSVPVSQCSSGEHKLHNCKTGELENLATQWPYEVAQVFGHTPEFFAEAAELVEKLGFDGIDINMGCPAHKVEENGSGAGLIRTPKLAQTILRVTKGATRLPVSVKTRIGVDRDVASEWMETLMDMVPANISLHGRTLKQLYQGRADWDAIARAAAVVHRRGGHILGNGDVGSVADAHAKVREYGVDGVLIGRAAEGNPGIFQSSSIPVSQSSSGEQKLQDRKTGELEHLLRKQRLAWAVEHAKIYEKIFGYSSGSLQNRKTAKLDNFFMPMRKHLAWYAHGFPGAVELRMKLMTANSAKDVERIVGEVV